mmetsp:Transcript_791/g.3263  ORF Transcript_791/g.3263 Transcript_791/m.3263 type:complete len:213 (+) Transcript_791:3929-4567(+)
MIETYRRSCSSCSLDGWPRTQSSNAARVSTRLPDESLPSAVACAGLTSDETSSSTLFHLVFQAFRTSSKAMAAASAPQLAGASGRPMRMLCSTRVWKSSSASSTVSVIARFGPSLAELAGRSTTSSGCRLKTRKSVAACDALSPRAQSIPKAQKLVIPHAFGPRREPWTVPRPRPRPSSKIRFVSVGDNLPATHFLKTSRSNSPDLVLLHSL